MAEKADAGEDTVSVFSAFSRVSEISTSRAPTITTDQGESEDGSHESIPVNIYQIKPSLREKFKELPVKEIIRNVLAQHLTGQSYNAENVRQWTITIANEINEKVKDLQMKRYRHIVQVILGELGAGVKSGGRCLWDSECDGYTSEIFMNDTIFCVTTVFAVYLY